MNWFNGTTNQFRCLVNHAGAVNNESQYGVNDGGLAANSAWAPPSGTLAKGNGTTNRPSGMRPNGGRPV